MIIDIVHWSTDATGTILVLVIIICWHKTTKSIKDHVGISNTGEDNKDKHAATGDTVAEQKQKAREAVVIRSEHS